MVARRELPRFALLLALPFALACGGGDTGDEMEADTAGMEAEAEMEGEMGMEGETGMADDPLAGTHEISLGTVEMADGRYTVRSAEGDSVLIQGRYMYHGDTVMFVDESGPMACTGQQGVYILSMEGGEPDLTLVSDPCEGRRSDITGEGGERGD